MLILVIEDEKHIRAGIVEMLTDEGYEVLEAEGVDQAIAYIDQEMPAVVLSDINLPDGDGFRILHYCKSLNLSCAVLLMTAYGSRELAIQAITEGADDYITKPIQFDELFARLHQLSEMQSLRGQVHRKATRKLEESKLAILGESEAMKAVRRIAEKAAGSDAPVLITGETGVGKGLLAKLIHASSPRNEKQLIGINCASIPESLLESELFGYRKGAFTGADQNKKGLFEEAGDGTLFLDEIGDMPMQLQAKLLHVLDDGGFRPLGSTKNQKFRGRIIAATNVRPQQLMKGKKFREDLYYRLSVLTIEIPPLRNRPEDILPLAERIFLELSADMGRTDGSLPTMVAHQVQQQPWLGNVRQLRNFLERTLILDDGANGGDEACEPTLADALRNFEMAWIRRAIDECDGDKAAAAKRLGIGVSTLYRKMETEF
ncbi:MAG: sigma-54 dependent transcriptional regulator [Mariprofundaceae bacterium]|nr:sigma-54 dependent transcriptional regulator [Mariprofundaceae bacterium]